VKGHESELLRFQMLAEVVVVLGVYFGSTLWYLPSASKELRNVLSHCHYHAHNGYLAHVNISVAQRQAQWCEASTVAPCYTILTDQPSGKFLGLCSLFADASASLTAHLSTNSSMYSPSIGFGMAACCTTCATGEAA